jgi:hypothetical protein
MRHYKAVDRFSILDFHKYLPVSYDYFDGHPRIPEFEILDPETGEIRKVVFVEKCRAAEGGEIVKITNNITIHYDPV